MASASSVSPSVRGGVAPLRAGQGYSFLLRRLHSLTGIVPVGAFLIEHFLSNAMATNGPQSYADQVKFLTGLPFALWLEIFGIYIPILYHAIYGFIIWWRGESNVADYPWAGNWLYSAQRWTGAIAFIYMCYHVYTMRIAGPHLFDGGYIYAFGKVQRELIHGGLAAFYAAGIIAASWHFAYGIWLFCAKWGITTGAAARKKLGYVCFGIAIVLIGVGLLTIKAFRNPAWGDEHKKLPAAEQSMPGVPDANNTL